MARAKQEIDIEALLVWAYRDQCVERQTIGFTTRGPRSSPASGLGQFLALGCRVDCSGVAERTLGVRVPHDALIVHDAVLSLDHMFVEWRGADDDIAIHTGVSKESLRDTARGLIMRTAEGGEAHVVEFVPSVLIPMHARAATRPECHPSWRAPRHRPPADGAKTDRWGRRRKSASGDGLSREDVMFARAQYCCWIEALKFLSEKLDGAVSDFVVLSPQTSDSPWLESASRVIKAFSLQNSNGVNALEYHGNKCA